MDKLREMSRGRWVAHGELLQPDSKVYNAFLEMESATRLPDSAEVPSNAAGLSSLAE